MDDIKLSIVTSLYKSSPYINEFYERISREAKKITDNYEIILVDDGSPDDSLSKAIELSKKDEKVVVIELSRNFKHHKALITGLAHAQGDYIFMIDSDLEEPPEILGEFWKEFHKHADIDVVYGVQQKRKGGWFERISGAVFYKLFNFLSEVKVPKNMITARLMNRRYADALLQFKEREYVFGGILYLMGFKQIPVYVEKKHKKMSTYNFGRKISIAIDAIISFSNFPLKVIFVAGSLISITSLIYTVYLFLMQALAKRYVTGWTSIIVSIWFLSGIIILCIGLLGIYISKIFSEVKERPFTIIRKIYKKGEST